MSPYEKLVADRLAKRERAVLGKHGTPRQLEQMRRSSAARERAIVVLRERHLSEYKAILFAERQAIDRQRGPLPE